MAILAGVVGVATLHFDRNDVERAVVMSASGLGIQINSVNDGGVNWHIPIE